MSDGIFLILLYAVAAVVLLLEIFIPSYGILCIVGFGILIGAIVTTFDYYGPTAGWLSITGTVVTLPVGAFVAVKIWPHTKIGRLIVPPNPVYTDSDFGVDLDRLRATVGQSGRSLSPLRPVGTCEFDGRRLQCVCESGMIDAGKTVRAIGLKGRNLEVSEISDTATA